jgi:hypothetical protein
MTPESLTVALVAVLALGLTLYASILRRHDQCGEDPACDQRRQAK